MKLELTAPAKINLSLEVLGKREDGYHEIVTVMQSINLVDSIGLSTGELPSVESRGKSAGEAFFGDKGQVRLSCDHPDLLNRENLVVKAALLMQEEFGISERVSISLRKSIPLAAGLGGGSSDAAAVILGLSRLWALDVTREGLCLIAAQLGSDVPFFLYRGTCLAEGRGERIKILNCFKPFHLVLLKPDFEIAGKTGRAYATLTSGDFTGGEVSQRLVAKAANNGEIDDSLLFNVFERRSDEVFAGLDVYISELVNAGARNVHLTGSGPTLYCLVESEGIAREICCRLKGKGLEAYWAESLSGLSAIDCSSELAGKSKGKIS